MEVEDENGHRIKQQEKDEEDTTLRAREAQLQIAITLASISHHFL